MSNLDDFFNKTICKSQKYGPVAELTISLSQDAWGALEHLICDPSIRSVSCHLVDPKLWRLLIDEQKRRAIELNSSPQEAFCLCGPDCGLADIPVETWGGDVHTPYEGICDGDLFFLPHWRRFSSERLTETTKLGAAIAKRCNHLFVEGDFGELPGTNRRSFGAWTMYSSRNPYDDCNPFRTSVR